MTRVFLIEDLHNTNKQNLESFGEIVYIYTDTHPNIWQEGFSEDMLSRFFDENFDPDLDYYAASGIMAMSHVALGTLVEEYGEVKCLLFDKYRKAYRLKLIGG